MKWIQLSLFALCLSFTHAAAQEGMKWGKIPEEYLQMKAYEPDTGAAALVLGHTGELYFDLSQGKLEYLFERHRRVKIFNRSAFDEGDITIPVYEEERVSEIQGHVYTPDGQEYTLKKSDIFEEKVTKTFKLIKFSLPNLTEGAVLEFRYKLNSNHFFQLESWYFQENIPTLWSEYKLSIPEWFRYVTISQGENLVQSNTSQSRKSVRVPAYTATVSGTRQAGTTTRDAMIKEYHYWAKDVPALRSQDYITTMDDYYAKIRYQLAAFQWPNETPEPVLSSWEVVAGGLWDSDNFGKQITRQGNFKRLRAAVEPSLAGITENDEKVRIIYNFLAKNVNWDNSFGILARESLDDCFEKKAANSAELNLMMLALLTDQGIPCYPLLVSTRDHGKVIDIYPIMGQFNHLMTLVEYDGQMVMMDAGSKLRPPGLPRLPALNKKGWVVDKTAPQWIDLPVMAGGTTILGNVRLEEDGRLSGTVQERYIGYDAVLMRSELEESNSDNPIQRAFKEKFPDAALEEIEIKNQGDAIQPLSVNLKCSIPDAAVANGDFIYVTPVLIPPFEENPLKLTKRDFPVEIPYMINEKRVLQVELPEGYELEETLEPIRLVLLDQAGLFTMSTSLVANKLQILYEFRITRLNFKPDEYPGLKTFFDLAVEKQNQQIVLKKK